MQPTLRSLCLFFLLCLWISSNDVNAQDHEHDSEHTHQHREHPKHEIGFGNYLSYLPAEKEFAYSLHIHFLRFFGESRFGAGLGYEQIFDDHRHRSLVIIGSYRPVSPLHLSLSPGILLGNQENPGLRFTLHTELVYEFEIGHFHLGPALDFATTFDEYHIGIGIHLAYAFM